MPKKQLKKENCTVSVVVPTYNERKNIVLLVDELSQIYNKHLYAYCKFEIIIVDDNSPDGTGKVIDDLAKKYQGKKYRVIALHRQGKLGLGTAVVAGFKQAKGSIVGVMDADLSHPPEIIPNMIEPILKGKAELTVGSRYVQGGGVEVWPWHRKLMSRIATLLASPLTKIHDPMSGLFFIKKDLLKGIDLGTEGYKIGLEIFVKTNYKTFEEVPYLFRNREFGQSKLNTKENMRYLQELGRLYWYKRLR
ncbi:polyprenol monophosphomannose synthase [Candidatus Woesearchaeota archaeon]|nr:polyprenol monophosphomannose synthase [Candidatus Woesearchaeota archaeon]